MLKSSAVFKNTISLQCVFAGYPRLSKINFQKSGVFHKSGCIFVTKSNKLK